MNHHRALALCLGAIFPENRFTLFRIMLGTSQQVSRNNKGRADSGPVVSRFDAKFAAYEI
jgi:hypothetical protein